jgi:site-specific DNA-cytosine methylase
MILYKTLEIIKYFQKLNPNLLFVIENPKGMMRNDKRIKGLNVSTTCYCLYGDTKRKITDFFNNLPDGLELKEVSPCPNPDIIKRVIDLKIDDKYSIPPKLIKAILLKLIETYIMVSLNII